MPIKPTRSNAGDEHIVVKKYLGKLVIPNHRRLVILETGAGKSTKIMAEFARAHNAICYSIDCCKELVTFLDKQFNQDGCVQFLIKDSTSAINEICEAHTYIDFAFLDAAPSALQTFRDFTQLESRLRPGSIVVVDNATLPGKQTEAKPARKGLILVPYLLAMADWELFSHPASGGQMIAAIKRADSGYADPRYVHPSYTPGQHTDLRIQEIRRVFNLP